MEEGKASLFKKMAAVMGEVSTVAKTGTNAFYGYHYATEADIVDEIRPLLAKHNIALFVSCTDVKRIPLSDRTDKQTGEIRPINEVLTQCALDVAFVDGETGETHTVKWYGEGQDVGDKGLSKSYTAAIKYLLTKTFLLSTGDDPESDERADSRNGIARPSAPEPPSEKQRGYLDRLLSEHVSTDVQVLEDTCILNFGHGLEGITKSECSRWIDALTGKTGSLRELPRKEMADKSTIELFSKLYQEARALGISDLPTLPSPCEKAEAIAKGKELRDRINENAKKVKVL